MPRTRTVWQEGINQAGVVKDVRTQFCMMQPSDLLSTLRFSHVTNGRASPDYASNENWFIGGSSMLFWAVGMRPSKVKSLTPSNLRSSSSCACCLLTTLIALQSHDITLIGHL